MESIAFSYSTYSILSLIKIFLLHFSRTYVLKINDIKNINLKDFLLKEYFNYYSALMGLLACNGASMQLGWSLLSGNKLALLRLSNKITVS